MREIKQSFISPLSQSSIQLSDSDEDLSSGTEYVPSDIDEEKEYERLETQTKEPINDDLFVDPSLGSHTVSFTMQVSAPIVSTDPELTSKCEGNP